MFVKVQTGSQDWSRFEAEDGNSHYIVFQLTDGRETQKPCRNKLCESYLDFAHELDVEGDCIEICDITEVCLVAGNTNGWLIASILTQVRVGNDYVVLTSDPFFNLWLDLNQDNTTQLALYLCRKSFQISVLHADITKPIVRMFLSMQCWYPPWLL